MKFPKVHFKVCNIQLTIWNTTFSCKHKLANDIQFETKCLMCKNGKPEMIGFVKLNDEPKISLYKEKYVLCRSCYSKYMKFIYSKSPKSQMKQGLQES